MWRPGGVSRRARFACGVCPSGSGSVGGVGGPIATLLEQNYAILQQFKQNMSFYKVTENTDLLLHFRDNILEILNQMNSMQVGASRQGEWAARPRSATRHFGFWVHRCPCLLA
jgi:Protein of unknown function (DUF3755)